MFVLPPDDGVRTQIPFEFYDVLLPPNVIPAGQPRQGLLSDIAYDDADALQMSDTGQYRPRPAAGAGALQRDIPTRRGLCIDAFRVSNFNNQCALCPILTVPFSCRFPF